MQANDMSSDRGVETMTATSESSVFESFFDAESGAWSLRRVAPAPAPAARVVRFPQRPRIRRVA